MKNRKKHLHPKAGCECPDCNLARVVIDTFAEETLGSRFPFSGFVEIGTRPELLLTDAQVESIRPWLEGVTDDAPAGVLYIRERYRRAVSECRCEECGELHDGKYRWCLDCRGKRAIERAKALQSELERRLDK